MKLVVPEVYEYIALRWSLCCMVQQATSSFAVRTFVTEFKLKKTFLNTTVDNHSSTHEVENEIAHTVSLLKGLLMPVFRPS